MIRSLVTSQDAQWAAVRIGRDVSLYAANGGPPTGRIELESDDVDLVLVGSPTVLVAIVRSDTGHKIVLYQTPYLEAVARLDLEIPARLAASTGPRIVVVSTDAAHAMVVRAVGRALATQKLEVTGPIEFVVGLERNQVLFGLHKKLEVWDAVSGRPLLRPQFQLPPAPRTLGPAFGHLWAMRNGSDELFVYRLSDGRPFRHNAAATIHEVICHPSSPVLVLVTDRGLLRLHCFSHSLTPIEGVTGKPVALAQLAVGEDVTLLGLDAEATEPWRVVISGATPPVTISLDTAQPVAPIPAIPPPDARSGAVSASAGMGTEAAAPPLASSAPSGDELRLGGKAWREQLALLGGELARGEQPELPVVAIDNELGDLAHRLKLSAAARRALIVLYGLHLIGEPSLPIARLAQLIGDWPEALGQRDLGQLAMIEQERGRVSLVRAVTDVLDGVPPRTVRIVGTQAPLLPRAGAWRLAREGRTDGEIERLLVQTLGRIAVVEGPLVPALLEARLHGATAVSTSVPGERPRPWPRDAGLVLVLYGTQSSWIADVPALPDA